MFRPYLLSVLIALLAFIGGLYFIDRTSDMEEEKYSIKVEWYDEISSLIRPFNLFYFPADRTVEMFDIMQKRTFLKRTSCQSFEEPDLYIGNTITVFGRDLKLIEYLNEATSISLARKAERTYAMLKPEVVKDSGKILSFIEQKGFRVNRMMMTKISANRAAEFYKEHQGRPFYDNLVSYISSGPVVAMELLAPSAISSWRKTLGPTDPVVARRDAPDSIRAHFGTDTTYNAAHGSDSPDAARRELSLIFGYQTSYLERSPHQTLCLIKPHIVQDGKMGSLIAAIQAGNFQITGMKMQRLTPADAERFFVAYKGVWEDYVSHLKHLSSGASVALSIASDVQTFRDFVGSFNPDIARKLQPSSIRAKFGNDSTHNAVHCTDLNTDGDREVEFFFNMDQSHL